VPGNDVAKSWKIFRSQPRIIHGD